MTETWTKTKEHKDSIVYEREVDGLYQSCELEKELIKVIKEE